MTALDELIAKVEAGRKDWTALVLPADITHAIEAVFGHHRHDLRDHIWEAYAGSLDAAKALHEAVLPGWDWLLSPSNAKVFPFTDTADIAGRYGMADNAARAWLLAILRAMKATPDVA